MTSRRAFLAGLVAVAAPKPSWADAGGPRWLACAREADGAYALFGIAEDGADTFRLPLPARGHAGAGHPHRPQAVVFARRPGAFALVLDCATGSLLRQLTPPEGMQFNGHGAFTEDGSLLTTTEQRASDSQGFLGLWDAEYRRIGQIETGGIGPHEVLRLPGDVFAVANGGIATDPSDRTKLNVPDMAPSLTYIEADAIAEQVTLNPALHFASIRHLAHDDGTLAFAMQWEGDAGQVVPLLGLHRRGNAPLLASAPDAEQALMQGYAGSCAFTAGEVAITSPRGGRLHRFDTSGAFLGATRRADICGLAPCPGGFLTTDGGGGVLRVTQGHARPLGLRPRAWDNHIVTL
ncbi:DUF1513 domain-containing protein [Pararhodobacter zhoushanensis]|uniref:DUF1513 domain-containing protein n=1 Tax=Pararhodobacter zhoushanensis TaxID=2479545 RepID=A0ABT3GZ69_9RHOB|nr:DUF1513 domain-containing protein [Pararhodobacter zhoushanensis]MCW1932855.1 DUF1513 domain-containing protein [Pararhodobacter zhoushanensis]